MFFLISLQMQYVQIALGSPTILATPLVTETAPVTPRTSARIGMAPTRAHVPTDTECAAHVRTEKQGQQEKIRDNQLERFSQGGPFF